MENQLDIHNRTHRLEIIKNTISESKVSKYNKDKLLQFVHYCTLQEKLSPGRLERMLGCLYKITLWLGKDFNKATKDDIMKVVEKINSNGYTDWTIYTYEIVIRKFWRWLEMPDVVSWLKPKTSKKTKLPEELLTTKEIERMIDVSELPRDKAFISCLYESGCRIGEIGTLKIKHVSFDNIGTIIIVNGKTGMRRIRLINSTKYLAKWLNQHAESNNPEANLWYGLGDKKTELLTYNALKNIIVNAVKKAKINKKVYPHLLRHSRLTELASELPEFQLKQYAGWGMDSKMAGVYIHLNGQDLDNRILEINGLKKVEKKELDNRLCPRCKTVNSPVAELCENCGMALNVKTAMEEIDAGKVLDRVLAKKPKLKAELFREMAKEMRKA